MTLFTPMCRLNDIGHSDERQEIRPHPAAGLARGDAQPKFPS